MVKKHMFTNHVLRSVKIPAGKSEIIFEYNDRNWKNTRLLSRVSFIAVLFGLGFLFWKEPKSMIEGE